jgi:hypothetical protein
MQYFVLAWAGIEIREYTRAATRADLIDQIGAMDIEKV